jgi:hypothetical protein
MQEQLPSSCPFFFFALIDLATSDVSQLETKRCLKMDVAVKDPKAATIGIIEKYDVVDKKNISMKRKIII